MPSTPPPTPFLRLCSQNRTTEVLQKIKDGTLDYSYQNCDNNVLHIACIYERTEIALALIRSGKVDLTATNNYRSSALIMACRRGLTEVVRELLTHPEVDLRARNRCGETALSVLASEKHIDLIVELLENGKMKVAEAVKYFPDLAEFQPEPSPQEIIEEGIEL